jgi:hypothetical protein
MEDKKTTYPTFPRDPDIFSTTALQTFLKHSILFSSLALHLNMVITSVTSHPCFNNNNNNNNCLSKVETPFKGDFFDCEVCLLMEPSMNRSLFFAMRAIIMDLLHVR